MNLGNSKVCLVLGGAQSGKSLFAENLIIQSSRPRRYIATAQAWDSEMEKKLQLTKCNAASDGPPARPQLILLTTLEQRIKVK